jgi:hypothetical protein
MAKQKNKKQYFNHIRKPVLVAIAGMLLLGVAWFLVINPLLNQRDKDRFLQAQAELEQIFVEKIQPVAEPDLVEREQSCRYLSRKYSEGPLNCMLSIHLAYVDIGSKDSVNLVGSISGTVDQSLMEGSTQVDDLGSYHDQDVFRFSQKINSVVDFSCSIGYIHPITLGGESLVFEGVSSDDEGLYVSMTCLRQSRAEHFPVQ